MDNQALVIAVDFGTAFSGYSFKFEEGERIINPIWGSEFGYENPKTPTCILFDEDGEFLEFGYDAVMRYTRHTPRSEAQKLYFFENFKMELYDQVMHRDLMVTARNGKKMRAMKVFSESLKYMKDHALEMIGKHTEGMKYLASDALWVLTVPAIWDAAAKQFMREAAVEAGLVTESDPERLVVALEPEAASVWCKQIPREGFISGSLNNTETIEKAPGTQYMVVDCGGGTIDITVHEMLAGGHLKELHKVSGNNMGGQTVDMNFRAFLRETISDGVFDEFEETHPGELQRLMYDFSLCKRNDRNALLQCSNSLVMIAERGSGMEDYFRGVTDVDWDRGELKLSREKMKSLHEDSLRAIESLIRDILKKPKLKISYIFLVGGFSLSPYVQKLVREKFGSQCKVLCPVDAQLAIVKGAVQFGTMPDVVESRICLHTYGIRVAVRFNESKHRGKSKLVTNDGRVYCKVCFSSLVKKDESVRYDEVRNYSFGPIEKDQTEALFNFYRTDSISAEFVDEWGVKQIGSVTVPMPNVEKGMNRMIKLEVRFGLTEMKATATDVESGKKRSVKLDFMVQ